MNRMERIIQSVVVAKSSWDSVFLKNLDVGMEQHNVMGLPYKKSDLVYICISTTGSAISQVPFKICIGEDDEQEYVPSNHPWQKRLVKPNPYMDKYSFVEAIVSYLMLDGDVFIIPFPSGKIDPPDALYVTSKKYVTPRRDDKTGRLKGWVYNPRGGSETPQHGDVILEPDDLVHIWFWNPYDLIMGFAPLEAGQMSITTDYKAAYFNANFFDEGASTSGVLSTEQKLNDNQYLRLKAQMDERYKGFTKSQRMMLLEGGLAYTQTSLSHKDMEHFDLRRFNEARILQIFKMKKAIISVTDDLNYATAKEQKKSWWQDTNIPIMKLISSAISFALLERFGLSCKFDTSSVEALHEDFKDKVETGAKLSAMGFTTNEINERLEFGFDEKPWRDIWWGPMSTTPLSEQPEEPLEDEEEILEEEEAILSPIIGGISSDREVYLQQVWEKIIRGIAPIEKLYEKKVKKIFYDMRKKSLSLLLHGSGKTVGSLNSESFEKEMKELEKISKAVYQTSIEAGSNAVASEVGISIAFDLNDPVVLAYLRDKNSKIKGIRKTIKKQISATLANGVEDGEAIAQLADRVRSVFNVAESRAKTIARTEVIGSSNFGRYVAIGKSGFKKEEWFTALDERVRKGPLYNHVAMHGKKKKIGDKWNTPGGTLRYPGDYMGKPGNIVNCRCIEIVVPEKE